MIRSGPTGRSGSSKKLALEARFAINPVAYAELSIGYRPIEWVEAILETIGVGIEEIPRAALFVAGKTFQEYRARGGTRTGVLPDFFIGAHAVVQGIGLLTCNTRPYRNYFPTIVLITPGDA